MRPVRRAGARTSPAAGTLAVLCLVVIACAVPSSDAEPGASQEFQLVEATITAIHEAIAAGTIMCTGVVQAYIDRARAYNNMCTRLVTEDGAPVPPATPASPPYGAEGASGATQAVTAVLGLPEIVVPAGYNQVVYEPRFVLSDDKQEYVSVSGTERSMMSHPSLRTPSVSEGIPSLERDR